MYMIQPGEKTYWDYEGTTPKLYITDIAGEEEDTTLLSTVPINADYDPACVELAHFLAGCYEPYVEKNGKEVDIYGHDDVKVFCSEPVFHSEELNLLWDKYEHVTDRVDRWHCVFADMEELKAVQEKYKGLYDDQYLMVQRMNRPEDREKYTELLHDLANINTWVKRELKAIENYEKACRLSREFWAKLKEAGLYQPVKPTGEIGEFEKQLNIRRELYKIEKNRLDSKHTKEENEAAKAADLDCLDYVMPKDTSSGIIPKCNFRKQIVGQRTVNSKTGIPYVDPAWRPTITYCKPHPTAEEFEKLDPVEQQAWRNQDRINEERQKSINSVLSKYGLYEANEATHRIQAREACVERKAKDKDAEGLLTKKQYRKINRAKFWVPVLAPILVLPNTIEILFTRGLFVKICRKVIIFIFAILLVIANFIMGGVLGSGFADLFGDKNNEIETMPSTAFEFWLGGGAIFLILCAELRKAGMFDIIASGKEAEYGEVLSILVVGIIVALLGIIYHFTLGNLSRNILESWTEKYRELIYDPVSNTKIIETNINASIEAYHFEDKDNGPLLLQRLAVWVDVMEEAIRCNAPLVVSDQLSSSYTGKDSPF